MIGGFKEWGVINVDVLGRQLIANTTEFFFEVVGTILWLEYGTSCQGLDRDGVFCGSLYHFRSHEIKGLVLERVVGTIKTVGRSAVWKNP